MKINKKNFNYYYNIINNNNYYYFKFFIKNLNISIVYNMNLDNKNLLKNNYRFFFENGLKIILIKNWYDMKYKIS